MRKQCTSDAQVTKGYQMNLQLLYSFIRKNQLMHVVASRSGFSRNTVTKVMKGEKTRIKTKIAILNTAIELQNEREKEINQLNRKLL